LRIQIVDDNIDAAATLSTLLELQGHEVSVEHDGRSALRRARLDRPQVLLLDIGLPDMDGYELARQIRAMPDTAGAVLVALTGYGQGRDRREAEAAGFDHYLVKPASMEQIEEILAQVRAGLTGA
jgi:CheY-like chemotaxis protein